MTIEDHELIVHYEARIAELEADNALISKSMLARVAELEAARDDCMAERDRLKTAHKAILALSQKGASDGIYDVDFRQQASDLARAALSDQSGEKP